MAGYTGRAYPQVVIGGAVTLSHDLSNGQAGKLIPSLQEYTIRGGTANKSPTPR